MSLFGKSLIEIKSLLDEKKVSPEEVFSYFDKRRKKYDKDINSYVTACDYKLPEKGDMYGLPIAIKDNFCTKGIKTTASSKVLDNFIPEYESTVTKKLKKAGTVFTGKTNMDAWAHGASTETSDYGLTKNPWDQSRYPGGSSGGSAAAVSAYLAPAAIGSDTGGSIRHPSAWCGVVGLKPTYSRVSRYGVIAMGSSLDCPGPMTQTVEDTAFILQNIAGKDSYDATSSSKKVPNYLKLIKEKKKLKIGVAREYLKGVDKDIKEAFEKSIDVWKKLGHEIFDIELLSPQYSISIYTIVQRAEVSSNLARFDGVRFGNDRSYFGSEAKRRMMLGAYTLSHGYYDAYYKKAQKVRAIVAENFKDVFKKVDVVVGPNTPLTALKIGEFKKYPFFGELMDQLNEPASVSGVPAISLPIGLDKQGLPIGMQIISDYFNEETLLNAAYQFEKETNFFDVIKKGQEKYLD